MAQRLTINARFLTSTLKSTHQYNQRVLIGVESEPEIEVIDPLQNSGNPGASISEEATSTAQKHHSYRIPFRMRAPATEPTNNFPAPFSSDDISRTSSGVDKLDGDSASGVAKFGPSSALATLIAADHLPLSETQRQDVVTYYAACRRKQGVRLLNLIAEEYGIGILVLDAGVIAGARAAVAPQGPSATLQTSIFISRRTNFLF